MAEESFSVLNAGTLKDWAKAEIATPAGSPILGKKFVKELIGATGCEISLNALAPGKALPVFHLHKENEEIYIFLRGAGEMQVDGRIFQVGEGSIVRIAPRGVRSLRNTGKEDLVSIVIQVREGSLRQYSKDDGMLPDTPADWVA